MTGRFDYVTHRHTASRVASRYLASKGKLVPEYQKAVAALEGGDDGPLVDFMESAMLLIRPGGTYPEWFDALGTVKRNAITKLYTSMQNLDRARKQWPANPKVTPEVKKNWLLAEAARWTKAVRTLEIAVGIFSNAALDFKHGPFTVVSLPGVKKEQADTVLNALDVATDKLRGKCPRVLYGKVFFSTTLEKGTAALYNAGHDALYLNVAGPPPGSRRAFSDVYTIIHELGHRHDARFLSNEGRSKYWELSPKNPVTNYGKGKPKENYAEGFAHFILGMDMPAVLAKILAEEI